MSPSEDCKSEVAQGSSGFGLENFRSPIRCEKKREKGNGKGKEKEKEARKKEEGEGINLYGILRDRTSCVSAYTRVSVR